MACVLALASSAALAGQEAAPRPVGIVLQRVEHPDTDTIRWVATRRSIERVVDLGGGRRLVRLDRFGRKVMFELDAALVGARELILDLRANRGGRLGRMLRVAARFTGPVQGALHKIDDSESHELAIEAPTGAVWHGRITLLVGAETRSSAEVLAALLRRHAGARVLGERTWGKDYAVRAEPVSHEWRVLVPDGRIEVPGETLAGGLLPDGPIPAELAARLSSASRPDR